MYKELNKKLAEWAGFEKGVGLKTFKKEGGTLYTQTNSWWRTPKIGKYRGEYENLPNFTQSSDACFTWLMPKIRKETEIALNMHPIEVACFIYADAMKFVGEAETPALALCLAIEKLIDKKEEVSETINTA